MSRRRSNRRLAGDLALSALRLPWSLTAWSVRQATGLIDARRPLRQTAEELDELSRAAAAPLDGVLSDLHRAGEHLQEGCVDSAVRLVSGSWNEPRAAFEDAWTALTQSWDAARGEGRRRRS
ncbi:MAG: hypothetical protein AAGE94_05950 [Acidobacteriota bacterium]